MNDTPAGAPALSKREKEILQLRAQGFSSKQIARMFGTDYQTVRNQLYTARQCLHAADTVQLMYLALKAGLID